MAFFFPKLHKNTFNMLPKLTMYIFNAFSSISNKGYLFQNFLIISHAKFKFQTFACKFVTIHHISPINTMLCLAFYSHQLKHSILHFFILPFFFFHPLVMAMLASAVLQPWIASFENIDWFNFRSHHLNSLRHIHSIPIRPELLHGATQFWDPEFHVFRFGLQELCPTVEEFHAYLETRPETEPVVPPVRANLVKVLKDKLGVSDGLARHLIRGGALDILRLFTDFSPCGNLLDFSVQDRRMFALCMCLLATYLLVPNEGGPNLSIVSVAVQIEQRKDVVPMVLAETLMGLDAVKSGRTNTFAGSPLLLQMWLCDKMKLVADPARDWVYQARNWRNRGFVEVRHSVEEWLDFFMAVEEDHVAWRCHWLPLPDMTAKHMGHSWVVLAGLTDFTFYFPQRILRQLGIRQEVESPYPADFILPEFKHSVLEVYRRTWESRVTWVRDQYPSIHLQGKYRRWLRGELKARFGSNMG